MTNDDGAASIVIAGVIALLTFRQDAIVCLLPLAQFGFVLILDTIPTRR